jgi:ribosomal protein S7
MKKQKISILEKMYNHLMISGKKFTCEKMIKLNIKMFQKINKKNHKEIFKLAIMNSIPTIQLRIVKKRKRKSHKEFPYVLRKKNRISLGIKSIINTSNQNLHEEILLFANNKSEILKKKETKLELAVAKKKFAFFRWFF